MNDFVMVDGHLCKEDFVSFMGKLKDKRDCAKNASDAMDELFGDEVGINFMDKNGTWWMLDYTVDLLGAMFGKKASNILYQYIYDDDWGMLSGKNGRRMTYSELYDELTAKENK